MRGVMSDEQLARLFEENERKRQEALAILGRRHLLHPANQVQNKNKPTPVIFAARPYRVR